MTRRRFIQAAAATAVLVACGDDDDAAAPAPGDSDTGAAEPEAVFEEPSASLSGTLSILMWSHFVPAHDQWFDPFAQEWGNKVGVDVRVDHINTAEVPGRIAAEIAAGEGHDLIQHIAPLAQFEPSVVDLKSLNDEATSRFGEQVEICTNTSFNPTTGKYYAFSPAWVPDPGDYRKSLWEQVGMPNGPSTWDELLEGGAEIKEQLGVQMGIGMSQEIDSNMAARALIWSFGGSVQDENENVVLNSPEVVDAVDFMRRLYEQTMTDEVFAWDAASNNQGLIAGQLSYIINSISAWRTAQEANPEVADDVFFVPALEGPGGQLAAQHVLYNWIVPSSAGNPDAAQEFLLHYTANMPLATYHSKLYDFPAFVDTVPQLNDWLADDPFSTTNKAKLEFLRIEDALTWSTNIGHPGPASTAIGEVFGTFILPNMMAQAARGQLSPQEAVARADSEVKQIFDKWRQRGLVGGRA